MTFASLKCRFAQMSRTDAIGVVREHRWASAAEQRKRLEADGVTAIIDLAKTDRDWLLTRIRDGGTMIVLAYAFLLTDPRKGAVRGLADYRRFTERTAKLPHAHTKPGGARVETRAAGYVKDLETGLVSDTPGARKAMLAVVKDQLARHGKGKRSTENGKRGRVALVLTELQDAKGEAIWLNLKRYRRREDAEKALREQVHKDLTHWSANKRWGPRQFGAKTTKR